MDRVGQVRLIVRFRFMPRTETARIVDAGIDLGIYAGMKSLVLCVACGFRLRAARLPRPSSARCPTIDTSRRNSSRAQLTSLVRDCGEFCRRPAGPLRILEPFRSNQINPFDYCFPTICWILAAPSLAAASGEMFSSTTRATVSDRTLRPSISPA